MASYIIHYIIGSKLLEKFTFDPNDFLLGNLLPDAHDGTLAGHSRSHFRYIVNGEYARQGELDYTRFSDSYGNNFDKSLILGYYCHLLSDHLWLQLNIPGFPTGLENDTKKFLKLRKLLHADYDRLNKMLIDYYQLRTPEAFVVPENVIVKEIVRDYIPNLLDRFSHNFSSRRKGKLKLITLDFIVGYINAAVDFCTDAFKAR